MIGLGAFSLKPDQHRVVFISIALAAAFCGPAAQAARRGVEVEDLVKVRHIDSLRPSPSGEYAAYFIRKADPDSNTYSLSWFAVDLRSRRVWLLADGGDPWIEVFGDGSTNGELAIPVGHWSPDNKYFAFLRRTEGQTQIWMVASDGSGLVQLTHSAADVIDFHWANHGRHIEFRVDRLRGEADDYDRLDGLDGILVGEPMPPVNDSARPNWAQCGAAQTSLIRVGKARQCQPTMWVYNFADRSEKLASPNATAEIQSLPGVTDGIALQENRKLLVHSTASDRDAWLENVNPGVFRGHRVPMTVVAEDSKSKPAVLCTASACSGYYISNLWWAPDGKSVYFLRYDGPAFSEQSLYRWTIQSGEVVKIYGTPESALRECSFVGEKFICIRSTWTKPDHIISINGSDGRVAQLADPNAEFSQFTFTTVERMVYDDGLGVQTYGHLVFPKDYEPGRKYPLIVVQYRSRGFLEGATGDEQPIHVMAQNGMFVLSTNLPEDMNIQAQSSDVKEINRRYWNDVRILKRPLRAISNAIDKLVERGLVDSSRIGIGGLSNGASIAEQAAVETDKFAAISVAYLNLSPLNYYLFPDSAARRELFDGHHPFVGNGREYWELGSSGLAAQNSPKNGGVFRQPTLIQVADREYFLTLQNYIDLKDADRPVEMFVYPNEYHVKWQPAHRLAIYRRNVDWFNYWLRGVHSGLSLDDDQYIRWQGLLSLACRTSTRHRKWYCGN